MRVFVNKCIVFCVVIGGAVCNPVMNNFNSSVREYAEPEEDKANSTGIRTLQKEEFVRYANFAPVRTPIKFKEIPDNALSSSSHHSRGLLHHEHNAYGVDYDDSHHYDHGDYNLHDSHHDHHLLGHGYGHHLTYGLHGHGLHDHHNDHGHHHYDHHDHHDHHDVHGHHENHIYHVDHGHDHHKHLAHALAAKTVLWPIAGIALLGAAAALVTNPVLLQLGVVSGRRKRDTQETTHFNPETLKNWLAKNPMVIARKISLKPEKTIEDENDLKGKTIDNFEIGIERKLKGNNGRNTEMNRQNKRMVLRRATSADPVHVNQSDLPRTETDEDKHYISIPLLTKS